MVNVMSSNSGTYKHEVFKTQYMEIVEFNFYNKICKLIFLKLKNYLYR